MAKPTHRQLAAYLRRRVRELRPICRQMNPWVFLCAAAFLGLLAKLAHGQDLKGLGYKSFIKTFFPRRYSKFRYRGAQVSDLPVQMYHVLRCGILHSFSLVADTTARAKGGRDRSIVLAHRRPAKRAGVKHLSHYASSFAQDACLFVAEDFLDDIGAVVEKMIAKAERDPSFAKKMLNWAADYPPVSGRFESGQI